MYGVRQQGESRVEMQGNGSVGEHTLFLLNKFYTKLKTSEH